MLVLKAEDVGVQGFRETTDTRQSLKPARHEKPMLTLALPGFTAYGPGRGTVDHEVRRVVLSVR